MNNNELFELVKTGSPMAGTLALALLNRRTSGAILVVASQMNKQEYVNGTGAKVHEA